MYTSVGFNKAILKILPRSFIWIFWFQENHIKTISSEMSPLVFSIGVVTDWLT